MNPRVIDNDAGEISVQLAGKEIRGWSYANDSDRRQKMLQAREYVEGWCDGRETIQSKLEYAYRCIEHGYVHGTFDFSVLRTDASNWLAELEKESP